MFEAWDGDAKDFKSVTHTRPVHDYGRVRPDDIQRFLELQALNHRRERFLSGSSSNSDQQEEGEVPLTEADSEGMGQARQIGRERDIGSQSNSLGSLSQSHPLHPAASPQIPEFSFSDDTAGLPEFSVFNVVVTSGGFLAALVGIEALATVDGRLGEELDGLTNDLNTGRQLDYDDEMPGR